MLARKEQRLIGLFRAYSPLALALSGGVDSGLLLAVARETLGDDLTVLTSTCGLHSERSLSEAFRLAEQFGARHVRVESARLQDEALAANTDERCYICKKMMWREIRQAIEPLGISHLADGVNADDLYKDRPGLKAGKAAGVISPLADAGLTKQEVRQLAKAMGLAFWNKPANSCLATRIPLGTTITPERLRMIEQAETVLLDMGIDQCRVRHYGDVACIEASEEETEKIFAGPARRMLTDKYRQIGFSRVALDLAGRPGEDIDESIGDSPATQE